MKYMCVITHAVEHLLGSRLKAVKETRDCDKIGVFPPTEQRQRV